VIWTVTMIRAGSVTGVMSPNATVEKRVTITRDDQRWRFQTLLTGGAGALCQSCIAPVVGAAGVASTGGEVLWAFRISAVIEEVRDTVSAHTAAARTTLAGRACPVPFARVDQ
jgi:hypothetical protein